MAGTGVTRAAGVLVPVEGAGDALGGRDVLVGGDVLVGVASRPVAAVPARWLARVAGAAMPAVSALADGWAGPEVVTATDWSPSLVATEASLAGAGAGTPDSAAGLPVARGSVASVVRAGPPRTGT
ncbi:MAG TPA: hypothetical protein VF542_20565 [Jatrophihabitans sp.]